MLIFPLLGAGVDGSAPKTEARLSICLSNDVLRCKGRIVTESRQVARAIHRRVRHLDNMKKAYSASTCK